MRITARCWVRSIGEGGAVADLSIGDDRSAQYWPNEKVYLKAMALGDRPPRCRAATIATDRAKTVGGQAGRKWRAGAGSVDGTAR